MRLRSYQETAVSEVVAALNVSDSVLLNAPTGSGKTRMAIEVCEKFGSVLWIVDRLSLLDQAKQVLGEKAGVIHSMYRANPSAKIQIVTRQTLATQPTEISCDLLVYDECHHSVAPKTLEVLSRIRRCKTLGLTATPSRSDRTPMSLVFDRVVDAAKYSELIAAGNLTRSLVISPSSYVGPHLAQPILESWLQFGDGRQTMIFCPRKLECYDQDDLFRSVGIRSAVILDDTPRELRSKRMAGFKFGKLDVLFSVSTLTEGVDFPAASCVVLARSFATVAPYMQACGRGMRSSEGKDDCVVIDLVGASQLHGPPDADREWLAQTPREIAEEREPCERESFRQEVIGEPLFASWLPKEQCVPWTSATSCSLPVKPERETSCVRCGRKLKPRNNAGKCATCLIREIGHETQPA